MDKRKLVPLLVAATVVLVVTAAVVVTLLAGSGTHVVTRTTTLFTVFPNGTTSTSTSITLVTSTTSIDCPECARGSNGPVTVTPHANLSSKIVTLMINDYYADNLTLTRVTVTGLESNSGYRGTTVVSLEGIRLNPGDAAYTTTQFLPALVAGDILNVRIYTSLDSSFSLGAQITVGT